MDRFPVLPVLGLLPACYAFEEGLLDNGPTIASRVAFIFFTAIIGGGLSALGVGSAYKAWGILNGTHVLSAPRSLYGERVYGKCGKELDAGDRCAMYMMMGLGLFVATASLAVTGYIMSRAVQRLSEEI